jgi:hypothetical protein
MPFVEQTILSDWDVLIMRKAKYDNRSMWKMIAHYVGCSMAMWLNLLADTFAHWDKVSG